MYRQEISRFCPGCVLLLIDQSSSMKSVLGHESVFSKAHCAARAVNSWLQSLIIWSSRSEGVRPYFDVGVIGYRSDAAGKTIIGSCLPEPIADRPIVPINEISNHPLRVESRVHQMYDEDTGEMHDFPVDVPIWVDAVARGNSPMCAMLDYACQILDHWTSEHRSSFPPIVVHFAGAPASDGNPMPIAARLARIATDDGPVIIQNVWLEFMRDALIFPSGCDELSPGFARTLFAMSSILDEPLLRELEWEGFNLRSGSRAFGVNCDTTFLLKIFSNDRPPRLR